MWQNYVRGGEFLTITYPYFSLFRVGVSRSHIHNNMIAGDSERLTTNTAEKNATIIVHYMHVPWFVIRC